MKILGIESSSQAASVALWQDDLIVGEYTLNFKLTHSQTLMPMLDEMFTRLEQNPAELDAVAVSKGPGSFTGLRIGAAMAKGLGLALDKPLIGVPTLHAMAYNLYRADGLICPTLDARRGQVYAGVYIFPGSLGVVREPECIMLEDLFTWLNDRGERVIFLGDGLNADTPALKDKLRVPYSFAPANLSRPRAGSVAALGAVYFKEGKSETAAGFAPEYLRKAQAEQALDEAKEEGWAEELKAGHIIKQEEQNDKENAAGRSGSGG